MDLSDRESRVLAALAAAPGPWAEAGRLARATRRRCRETLAALVARGLVCAWEADRGGRKLKSPRYTFTPLGAYLFDLRLDEASDFAPAWFPGYRGRIDQPLFIRYEPGTAQLRLPALVPDHRPGPPQYLIDCETHATTADLAAIPPAARLWGMPIPVARDRRRRAPAGGAGGSSRDGHAGRNGTPRPAPAAGPPAR